MNFYGRNMSRQQHLLSVMLCPGISMASHRWNKCWIGSFLYSSWCWYEWILCDPLALPCHHRLSPPHVRIANGGRVNIECVYPIHFSIRKPLVFVSSYRYTLILVCMHMYIHIHMNVYICACVFVCGKRFISMFCYCYYSLSVNILEDLRDMFLPSHCGKQ